MIKNMDTSQIDDLISNGFVKLKLTEKQVENFQLLECAAEKFFDKPLHEKTNFEIPGRLDGYHATGSEYSKTKGRPDLNETFAVLAKNIGQFNQLYVGRDQIYPHILTNFCFMQSIATSVLETLRSRLFPLGKKLSPSRHSYVQVNYYRPKSENRSKLQDAHEDGHLLTLSKFTKPGLQIKNGDEFRAVLLEEDEIIVMAGSILSLMTGGKISPAIHRVVRNSTIEQRISVLFFCNPPLEKKIEPWNTECLDSNIDVVQATIERSTAFGLNSIKDY